MKFNIDLQKLLPFGYLFLVVIGVLKESIFYYHIGINILKYSNIMDILISPIADITSTPMILVSLIVITFIFYLIILYLSKNYHNLKVNKFIGSKTNSEELTEL